MRPVFRRELTDTQLTRNSPGRKSSFAKPETSQYKLLLREPSEEEDLEAEPEPAPAIASPNNYWRLIALILAVTTIAQSLAFIMVTRKPDSQHASGFPGLPEPQETFSRRYSYALRAQANGTLYAVTDTASPVYVGPPSTAIDQAWTDLIEPRYFRLHQSEIVDLNHDENVPRLTPLPMWQGAVQQAGVYAGIDMMHSLHCVNSLRKALHANYYAEDEMFLLPGETRWLHLDHCVEQLRQAVLCHGDTTPVTLRPVVTELENGGKLFTMLGETEREHTCKDFEQIRNWVKQQAAERGHV